MLQLRAAGDSVLVYKNEVKVATVEFMFDPYEGFIDYVDYVSQHVDGTLACEWRAGTLVVTFEGETVSRPVTAHTKIYVVLE